ncbi:MAG: hypothetical protein GY945_15825 [Rhodobacteraceae bacterium]|nr:hypothetical protein [Paracoccaceae bacterium]
MRYIAAIVLTLLASPLAAQSVPMHGNWCGLGHSGSVYALPPTDALDAACMRHDICIGQRGRFSCGCDVSLMQELRATPWPNPGYQAKARAIYDTIAVTPCSDPSGMAVKTEMFMSDWARGVLSGQEAPWEVLRRMGLLGADGVNNSWWGGY